MPKLRICATVICAGMTASATATLVDAAGDAQDAFGAGDPLLDIDTISVLFDETAIHVTMTFHTPISAPSLGQADGIVGLFEFDTDQNVGTGLTPLQNFFSPPFAPLSAGIDFLIDLSSELVHAGLVDVYETASGSIVDVVAINYGPQSLSASISLSSLGGDDGLMDFTTIIGTLPQPTDATDTVGTSKLVPVPGVLALLGLAGLRSRRRRSAGLVRPP